MSVVSIPTLKNYSKECSIVYTDVERNPKSSVMEISKRTGLDSVIVTEIVRFYCGDDEWGAMDCYFIKGMPRYSILDESSKIPVRDCVDFGGNEVDVIIDERWIPEKTDSYIARLRKALKV